MSDVHIGVIPASRRSSSVDIAVFELGEFSALPNVPDKMHKRATFTQYLISSLVFPEDTSANMSG